jgi:hypothetical protein
MAQSQRGQAVSEHKLIINPEWEHAQFVSIAELHEWEQKLKAANDEINMLRIIISRASTAFFCDGKDAQVAKRMLSILNEAKEAKP